MNLKKKNTDVVEIEFWGLYLASTSIRHSITIFSLNELVKLNYDFLNFKCVQLIDLITMQTCDSL
jgi:hypothetical protein